MRALRRRLRTACKRAKHTLSSAAQTSIEIANDKGHLLKEPILATIITHLLCILSSSQSVNKIASGKQAKKNKHVALRQVSTQRI